MPDFIVAQTLIRPVGVINLDNGRFRKFTEEELSKIPPGTKPVIDDTGRIIGIELPYKENKMSNEILLSDENNAKVVGLLMSVAIGGENAMDTLKRLIKDHRNLELLGKTDIRLPRAVLILELHTAATKSTAAWRLWLASAGTHVHEGEAVDCLGRNWVQREWVECKKIEQFLDEAAKTLGITPVGVSCEELLDTFIAQARENHPASALEVNGYRYELVNPIYPTKRVNED